MDNIYNLCRDRTPEMTPFTRGEKTGPLDAFGRDTRLYNGPLEMCSTRSIPFNFVWSPNYPRQVRHTGTLYPDNCAQDFY